MTAVNRAFSNLTLAGKILLPLLFLVLVVGPIVTVLLGVFIGPWLLSILSANIDIVRFVVAVTAILLFSIPAAFMIIYMEMKVIALMNLRVGPDRVGPFGSLLSVVHGLKVLMKEDFTPTGADSLVFTWAPVIVFLTAVMTFLVIPFGPGLVGQDLEHRPAVPVRGRRHDRRRPADGGLVELQQVLAAGRAAVGRPGRQLRDPADAVGRRPDPPRRDDEPQPDRACSSPAGSPTGSCSASRWAR